MEIIYPGTEGILHDLKLFKGNQTSFLKRFYSPDKSFGHKPETKKQHSLTSAEQIKPDEC